MVLDRAEEYMFSPRRIPDPTNRSAQPIMYQHRRFYRSTYDISTQQDVFTAKGDKHYQRDRCVLVDCVPS